MQRACGQVSSWLNLPNEAMLQSLLSVVVWVYKPGGVHSESPLSSPSASASCGFSCVRECFFTVFPSRPPAARGAEHTLCSDGARRRMRHSKEEGSRHSAHELQLAPCAQRCRPTCWMTCPSVPCFGTVARCRNALPLCRTH